jgi:hypothetical protein
MKPEKGPAAMHLQRPSLLSKEWGEVQISWAEENSLNLTFTDAYRTPEEHANLQKATNRAAQGTSLHQIGYAVDIPIDASLKKLIEQFKKKIEENGLKFIAEETGNGTIYHVYLKYDGNLAEKAKTALDEYKKLVDEINDRMALSNSFYEMLNDPFFSYGAFYMR